MTGLALIWLTTAVTIVLTAVVFVALAEWSAGGAAPWSIVPGFARGVRDWLHREEDLEPLHVVSPRAEEPPPVRDTAALPLPPLETEEREPEAWVEEYVDADELAEIEVEDLGRKHIGDEVDPDRGRE